MKEFLTVEEATADPEVVHIELGKAIKGYYRNDILPRHCQKQDDNQIALSEIEELKLRIATLEALGVK